MTERQIFQSERYPDVRIPSNIEEQLTKLLQNRKYQQIIQKCGNMEVSKKKYILLSYAYLGLREWKNLIQSCENGIQLDSNQSEFYSWKAKACGKLGKNHQKILLLQKAISLNNQVASYHRNLGSAYFSIQNYDLSCKQYDKAIQLEPDNIFNYHNKGSALFKKEQYNQAKEYFLIAIQKNPNIALSYSWLADCQKMLGNYDEAQKLYNKAYEMSQNKVYLQQKLKLSKQKNLKQYEGSWYYGIAWLGSKIM